MCSSTLPSSLDDSLQIWNDLQVSTPMADPAVPLCCSMQGSNWPVLCHGVAILLASLSVSRGVSTIEPVNKVSPPLSPFDFFLLFAAGNSASAAIYCSSVFLLVNFPTLCH